MPGEIDRKCRLVKRWAAVAANSRPICRDARPRLHLEILDAARSQGDTLGGFLAGRNVYVSLGTPL